MIDGRDGGRKSGNGRKYSRKRAWELMGVVDRCDGGIVNHIGEGQGRRPISGNRHLRMESICSTLGWYELVRYDVDVLKRT